MTSMGVGSFIFYHPRLSHLEYEQSVGALANLQTLGNELDIGDLDLVDQNKILNISINTLKRRKQQAYVVFT